MRGRELLDALGNVEPEYIEAAETARARGKIKAVRWAALAACLGVAVAIFLVARPNQNPNPDPDELVIPDGMDRDTYFTAQFPDWEAIDNVASTERRWITELSEAEAVPQVGGHLPSRLPEGYRFESAVLTETTMKDGTVYYMLEANFICPSGSGNREKAAGTDGTDPTASPDSPVPPPPTDPPETEGAVLCLEIRSYPVSHDTRGVMGNDILDYSQLTAGTLPLEQEGSGETYIPYFYVNFEDFSVFVMNNALRHDPETIMDILNSMT